MFRALPFCFLLGFVLAMTRLPKRSVWQVPARGKLGRRVGALARRPMLVRVDTHAKETTPRRDGA